MLNFLKKLFQMIFGGGKTASTEENIVTEGKSFQESEDTIQETPLQPDTKASGLHLARQSYGKYDTLGKLFLDGEFVAFTLESPQTTCVKEGTYPLSLRKKGGKHSSYWFRFKEMHKGMIFVEDENTELFSYLSIGNIGKEAKGSILLGTEVKNETSDKEEREIWYSTQAYKSIYPKLAKKLESGKDLQLEIKS